MAINQTITSSVSSTDYITGGNQVMVVGVFKVTSAALLGTATVTFTWQESSAVKTHTEQLLLTVLGNVRPFMFRCMVDTATTCTWAVSIAGLSGGFSAQLTATECNPYE